jgi:hypothetical protein
MNNHTPTQNTGSISRQNRVFAPIILGITIILAVIVARPLYMSHIDLRAQTATLESELSQKEAEYTKLLSIKNSGSGGLSLSDKAKIDKISKRFDKSDVMEIVMLSEYTRETFESQAKITVNSITVGDATKLPNGLSMTNVGLSLQGRSIDDIINYISYLTLESPFVFTLDNISLPIDTAPEGDLSGGYSLSITLGVYSYE